jgi:hypothetical protein
MFPSLSLLLSIFVTYPKEKNEKKRFFFFEKFGYAWGMHAEVPQEYEYPKNIRYGYGSIFGVPVLHRLSHTAFTGYEFIKRFTHLSHFDSMHYLHHGEGQLCYNELLNLSTTCLYPLHYHRG